MRFRRLLAAFGIVVLGTVGTLAVTAAPAQATACSSGQLCTYWNVMSGDPMYYYTTPIWTCLNIGAPWNNQISSIDNRRSFTITIWDDYGCASGSRHVTLGPSTYIYDLGWPDLFNDRASSISFGW